MAAKKKKKIVKKKAAGKKTARKKTAGTKTTAKKSTARKKTAGAVAHTSTPTDSIRELAKGFAARLLR